MKLAKPAACLISFSLLLASCATYRLPKDLDPDSREFLSKVRYIITKEERKSFLSLPPSERSRFIEEFWDRRDPDPDTEENEFREEYYKRIEEANHLFTEGSAGWLQDRGRVYILLGPPWERQTFPRGVSFYGKPTEIWYYGYFPIIFIDQSWSGDYRLDPQSSWEISEINKAQMEQKPLISSSPEDVDLDFKISIDDSGPNRITTRIEIPYKNIWFAEHDNRLDTSLSLSIEIQEASGNTIWEHNEVYPLSLTEAELRDVFGQSYSLDLQVDLPSGSYTLKAELENQTDEKRTWKTKTFSVR